MIITALDLSIRTGIAVFDTSKIGEEILIEASNYDCKHKSPLSLNLIEKDQSKSRKRKSNRMKYDSSNHPDDFVEFIDQYINELILKIIELTQDKRVDIFVIEQTNKGRDRWRQKMLEWLHLIFYQKINYPIKKRIEYVDSFEWAKILNLSLSKHERKHNKEIRQHNRSKSESQTRMTGITDSKDLSIRFAEEKFNLKLLKKENDIADAICLGYAWLIKNSLV